MSCDKETCNKGYAYVAFSHVTALEKLHIYYIKEQIKVSDTADEEMERLKCNTLQPEPVSMIHAIDHNKYLSLLHLNIANL